MLVFIFYHHPPPSTPGIIQVDPQRVWKSPWRWYAEELLECCAPLTVIKETGITLTDFECLAKCNSCDPITVYAENSSVKEYALLKATVVRVCTDSHNCLRPNAKNNIRSNKTNTNASSTNSEDNKGWLPTRHLVVAFSRKVS